MLCPVCGSQYEQPKYREKKTCSAKCGQALAYANQRVTVNCGQCGKESTYSKSTVQKYCSNECRYAAQVGQKMAERVRDKPGLREHVCEVCQKEFSNYSDNARFCSRKCHGIGQRKNRVCPCGKEFWLGLAMENNSKFCSDECRDIYGLTKKEKFKSATCVGCGEEFTRPQAYTSIMKYCSNKCAKKEHKRGWSKTGVTLPDNSVLIFRSGYELRFYAACLRFNIPIRNYDGPDIQTSLGIYRPDFIADFGDGMEDVVEVKGWMDPESETKVNEAMKIIPNFVVFDKDSLYIFERDGV